MTVQVGVERITPKKAREYLEANTDNYRGMRKAKIHQYARSMREGNWLVNGESIKFSKDGTLLDGQNRLQACVEAGKPFKIFVMRGIDPKAVETMDTGAVRSVKDHLKRRGYTNVASLAAAARWCWLYEHDSLLGAGAVSSGEVISMVEDNPRLDNCVQWVRGRVLPFMGSAAKISMVLRYYTGEKLPGEFDAFYEQLRSGEGLVKGDPILALRVWLEWNGARNRFSPPRIVEGAFIKAWNAWILGHPMQQLSFNLVGPRAEEFPQIVTERETPEI